MLGYRVWSRRVTIVATMTVVGAMALSGVAFADNIIDDIVDDGAGVTLVAGSSVGGVGRIKLVATGGDTDLSCNIDPGDAPLVLDIVTPAGVTANPDPLIITSCGNFFSVTFTASAGAVSGNATVEINSGPAGGGSYNNNVIMPITVTHPNTAPSVSVGGVADGASYEIGSVPVATCEITDAEDGVSSAAAVITGTLSHGLGPQTATCDYTDNGGFAAATATATYTIVDTGDPTIAHALIPSTPDGNNGWYKQDVTVTFTCADVGGSGIDTCLGGTSLGEGEDQSVTGTATDWAGNTATDTVSDIDVDKTVPNVSLVGGPGASYYFGEDPAAPTCSASDELSGLASCQVTGGGTTVGTHSYVATATDNAGNTATVTLNFTVLAWTANGYYAPVDMGGVWNTVKGGSTVPLKFELFAGPTELSSTSAVTSFKTQKVSCTSSTGTEDAIELLTTGATSLRYDSTAGQFIQNWKTPTGAGNCYSATMTSNDGSTITALFKIK